MEIVIKGDILDYIDENELKDEVRNQIRYQIGRMLCDDKEIKNAIVSSIVNEVKDISFTEAIMDALKNKFTKVIYEEYIDGDNFHIKYDAKIPEKVKQLFEDNEEVYSMVLQDKIDKAINDYTPDEYLITELATTLILKDEKCVEALKNALQERIYDIIDKI